MILLWRKRAIGLYLPLLVIIAMVLSVSAQTYQWDFGDGTTSQSQNANHIYNKPGTYRWTLKVTHNGSTCQQAGTIVVKANTQLSSIQGKVTDLFGKPIAGASVNTGSGYSAITNSSGQYVLSNLPPGKYTFQITKSGYYFSPAYLAAIVPPSQNNYDFSGGLGLAPLPANPPTPQTGKPFIVKVEPCIQGPYYFNPSPLKIDHQYNAEINWQGQSPERVIFNLNGNSWAKPASGVTVSHTFDLGKDFKFGTLAAVNNLSVQAVAANGAASNPFTINPIGINIPSWLLTGTVLDYTTPKCHESVWVKGEFKFPDPVFNPMYHVPVFIPILGDNQIGIRETQAGFKWEIGSDGQAFIRIFGETGFKAAGQDVYGKLGGKGTLQVNSEGGITLEKAGIDFEIFGKIEKTVPVIDLICKAITGGTCPLKELESAPVVGKAINWLNKNAQVKGEIQPGIAFTANFRGKKTAPWFQWDNGTIQGKIRLILSLIMEVLGLVDVEVYGGGEPSITIQTPPNPSYLKELAVELFAGIKIHAFGWQQDYSGSYKWSKSPSVVVEYQEESDHPILHDIKKADWRPVPRDYAVNPETYAVFEPETASFHLNPRLEEIRASEGQLSTQESLLTSNIYPYGHPVIVAAGSSSASMLWVHDDISKPIMQGKEIFFSRYNGSSWSAPSGITNDNLQDFSPQVALDGNNRLIAIWERSKTIQSDQAAFNVAYSNSFEIAYSIWNGSTWSSPVMLTENSAFDHAPFLARGNDGRLLLIWRQHPSGEMMGTAADPETILYSIWDGSGWSSAQIMLNEAKNITGIGAARKDAGTMAVVFSQDTDSDISTSNDQELFLVSWNGSSWSTPSRLTNDAQADTRPTLFYHPVNGSPRLLWIKGQTLYALLGSLSGEARFVASEESATILDYSAAQDISGRMAILWQGLAKEGVDVFYSSYNEKLNLFSLVGQLTFDKPMEKFMSAAFTSSGELLLGYNKTLLVNQNINDNNGSTIQNITTFGQTSLYALRHTFGLDLLLSPEELNVTPANPTSDSPVILSAILHNVGDEPIASPAVSFYHGNPSAGGALIKTVTDSSPLIGGDSVNLSAEWKLPASSGPYKIYAVADPSNTSGDINPSNNTAYIDISLPDLTVSYLKTTYGTGEKVSLIATVWNQGVTGSGATNVDFRLNDPLNGALLGTRALATLPAEGTVEVTLDWDAKYFPAGSYRVYAVVDPEGRVKESEETNNYTYAGLGVLPDLELHSSNMTTYRNADGTISIAVWVTNSGSRPADSVVLGIYGQSPAVGLTPLSSTTLRIQPGETRSALFNLGNFTLPGFYVGVGFSAGCLDRNWGDNSFFYGFPPELQFTYLPIIGSLAERVTLPAEKGTTSNRSSSDSNPSNVSATTSTAVSSSPTTTLSGRSVVNPTKSERVP